LSIGVAALTSSTAAAASDEPFHLAWVRGAGAEACVGDLALAARVAERLGRDPFSSGARRTIEGYVTRDGRRWTAHLTVHDGTGAVVGARDLSSDADDCEAVEAAVTLAIALAIDPEAALRPPPETPAPPPPPPPPEVAACPSTTCPPPPPNMPASLTGRLSLSTALLPKTALGVGLAADVEPVRRIHGTVGFLLLPETKTAAGDFAFGLTAASLGACGDVWTSGSWAAALCGQAYGGAIHSVVLALEPTTPGDRLWLGAGASARLSGNVFRALRAEVAAEATAPLVRHRFFVEGAPGTVFQQAPVGALVSIGVGMSIP
jgi:hypothetical protein